MVDSTAMARDAGERTEAARGALSSDSGARSPRDASWPAAWPLGLYAAFGAIAWLVYRPALEGPFISDDIGYLVANPYTAGLALDNLRAMLDPWGDARYFTANYAPVHLLLHALERHIFADAFLGYHLVNVAIHALNAVLLTALLRGAGLGSVACLGGSLFFLLHPANVEAVAWISQLKTNGSLAFALGALLAFRRLPALAALLFALSLLTKASGLFALPTAAALAWLHRGSPGGQRSVGRWLGVWLLLFALYAVPELGSFGHRGGVEVEAFDDRWVHARTIAAVGMRYLVMAATGWGVGAFQEPPPATSWLDPWWLAALPAGALLAWRLTATLRRRSVEAAFWIAAAASFAPVSQLFPFLNPVADRYLYFILPGLIGGALLWFRSLDGRTWTAGAGLAASIAAGGLMVWFGAQSTARAALWRNETLLLLDAARHYPDGGTAHFLRARSAAQEGRVEDAVAAVREASGRGIDRFAVIRDDPGLAPIRDDPAFRALIRDLAGRWIETVRKRGNLTQPELRMLARAHLERDEYEEAIGAYEAALRTEGPLHDVLRSELDAARRLAGGRVADRADAGGQGDRTR